MLYTGIFAPCWVDCDYILSLTLEIVNTFYLNLEIYYFAQNEMIFLYKSDIVAEKIKILSKSKGIKLKKLLEDVGLGYNTMSNMKTSMPKADNLARIADYLNCSVDYLLGRTDNPEINK